MANLYKYEQELIKEGHQLIAGIDEAGRGPLAGPLVVALCILPLNYYLDGLVESKQLSANKRAELYDLIINDALYYEILEISVSEVDKLNIYQATKQGSPGRRRHTLRSYL